MKSVMGELTDPSNRAEGFALLPVVWSAGGTLGYIQSYYMVFKSNGGTVRSLEAPCQILINAFQRFSGMNSGKSIPIFSHP